MSEEKNSVLPLAVAAILGLVPLFCSVVFGFPGVFSSSMLFLSSVLLGFTSEFLEGGKKLVRRVLLVLSSVAFLASIYFQSPYSIDVPFTVELTRTIAFSFPALSLLLLTHPLEGYRGRMTYVLAPLMIPVSLSLGLVIREHLFLYSSLSSFGVVETISWAGLILMALALLFDFFSLEKRNSYTVVLLCLSGLAAAVSMALVQGVGLEGGILGSGSFWYVLLVAFLYIYNGRRGRTKDERRVVTFSNMVYEELKPIKKRSRARKYEIPPNVPVRMKDLTEEKVKTEEPN